MVDKRIVKKLEKLADDNEKKMEEIMVLFLTAKNLAKQKAEEDGESLTGFRLDARAYNGLKSYFNNTKFNKGEEFSFIPCGVAIGARDKNEELRNKILKRWAEPKNRLEMIQNGEVMTMKVDNKKVPVKKIDAA
jgi:hypothetical protein